MGRFVEVSDRDQVSFLPACLEDYVDADNPVRIIDAFVDELDLAELGFARVQAAAMVTPQSKISDEIFHFSGECLHLEWFC